MVVSSTVKYNKSEIKGDVGMSLHEKAANNDVCTIPRQKRGMLLKHRAMCFLFTQDVFSVPSSEPHGEVLFRE